MKNKLQSLLVIAVVILIGFFACRTLFQSQKSTKDVPRQVAINEKTDTPQQEEVARNSESSLSSNAVASDALDFNALRKSLIGKSDPEVRALIEAWLENNTDSDWVALVKNQLAKNYYQNGYFDQATHIWDELWDELKSSEEPSAVMIADEVAVALLKTNVSLSRADRLKQIIVEVEQRTTNGTLEAALYAAKNTVWLTEHTGAQNITCGALALNALGHYFGNEYEPPKLGKVNGDYINTGLPLTKLAEFATTNYKIDHLLVKREDASAPYPTPSVVHLKNDHYIAVTEFDSATQKYFIDDRTLSFNGWIEKAALELSASGNLLLAANDLPNGFSQLTDSEARRIFGRDGAHGGDSPEETTTSDDDESSSDNNNDCGMPRYAFHNMPAALVVRDTPLWYETAVGPDLRFRLTYNELNSSRGFYGSGARIGQDWNMDLISWVLAPTGSLESNSTVVLHAPGGGVHVHKFDSNMDPIPHPKNQSILERVSANNYTRTFPSGIVETYSVVEPPDVFVPGAPNQVFLSSIKDSAGNAITYTYDTINPLLYGFPIQGWQARRLKEVESSATGLKMTLFYDDAHLPMRLSRVQGPFGRQAVIEYENLAFFTTNSVPFRYRISAITDMGGLRSTFEYQTGDGFLQKIVTPYGTTSFWKGNPRLVSSDAYQNNNRIRELSAQDPMGQIEKIAFVDLGNKSSVYVAPDPIVSPGSLVTANWDTDLRYRNTFYWSKQGYANGDNDPDNATISHYWTSTGWKYIPYVAAIREPHSDWTWYSYPGSGSNLNIDLGGRPDKVLSYSRVNGEVRANLVTYEFNEYDLVTKMTDALGRETEYIYDTTFPTEIAEVRQKVGTGYETLSKTTYYSSHPTIPDRLPHFVTDAAGRTTTFTYNDKGQVLTVTEDTLNRVATYNYGADVYLDYIDQAAVNGVSGRSFFEYDSKWRLNKTIGVDGYYTEMLYDDFNRPERVTFPDGTSIENIYDRLHLSAVIDRQGRVTQYTVDPLRRVTSVTDPLNLTTRIDWCRCGAISQLTDPKNQVTRWEYDSAHRLLKKQYADDTVDIYVYDSVTGQLSKSTNSATNISVQSVINGTATSIYNTRTYDYLIDGSLASFSYADEDTSARPATPSVSYTYDPDFTRVATMTDGIGTTTYTYYPNVVGENGAGQLQSIDGPWVNDTVVYTYDSVGRPLGQTINGVSYMANAIYDELDRLKSYDNLLGSFATEYVGLTERIDYITTPVSKTTFGYTPLDNDYLVDGIHHQLTNNTNIDQFSYGLNVNGRIDTLTHQVGTNTPLVKEYGYDNSDQLTSAVISQGGVLQKHYAYTYDTAYNRASKQVGEYTSTSTHNQVNEHNTVTGGGPTHFYGSLDEPARVTIDGNLAKLDANNYYEGFLDLPAGTHDITIEATDGNGNVATEVFNVTVQSQTPATYTYDNEGNTATKAENGVTTTYRWNAENRLVSITQGTQVSEFFYDGLGRRVKIVEKDNGVITSEKRFIWCNSAICEERDASNQTLRHYFGEGEVRTTNDTNPGSYYYLVDHLGSTQTVLNGTGDVVARYEYSPYGEVTQTEGVLAFDFLYTGHYLHKPSNFFLAPYRAYDPAQGRWLSRDPIAENGGINLYAYVGNDPINELDPLGLAKISISSLSQMSCADQTALFEEFGIDRDDFQDNLFVEVAKFLAIEFAANYAIGIISGGTSIVTRVALRPVARGLGFVHRFTKYKPKFVTKKVAPCFIVGTLVATPDGDVAIQELEEGDIVYAFDFETGEVVEQKVLQTFKNFTYYWIDIDVGDEVITATRKHRFWVESENDWLAAIDLEEGMTVLSQDGEVLEVLSVNLRELESPEDTFNLEVEDDHNYFVGASGTLVHNGYPESPKYPPATQVGENFQFNFDDSPGRRNSRSAGVRRATAAGYVQPGEIGHHINSVQSHPHLAAEPDNIEAIKTEPQHRAKHGGNYKNPTSGPLRKPGC